MVWKTKYKFLDIDAEEKQICLDPYTPTPLIFNCNTKLKLS